MKPLFMFLLASSLYANAQDFKEWVIYDVNCPVKDVSLKTNTFYLDKLYFHYLDDATFNTDGKKNDTVMQFDNEGYPIGWALNIGDYAISYKVNYDAHHRVTSTQMMSNVSGSEKAGAGCIWNENRSFGYEINSFGNAEISRMSMLTEYDGDESVTEYVYTDYVYDDQGNWIRRNVSETEVSANQSENTLTREYLQTRKILYFD